MPTDFMTPEFPVSNLLVDIQEMEPGRWRAVLCGSSDLSATADTREEAISQLQTQVQNRISAGSLELLNVCNNGYQSNEYSSDEYEDVDRAYLEELATAKRLDLERTLREMDEECGNTSSIPTT